ncbi:ATP-binding protein [[Clostridium] spiroforme]|nr:ATP-binding protein [Thomasclavelia spiroformis]
MLFRQGKRRNTFQPSFIRKRKKATIITSNLKFDCWNEIFNDSVLAGAMIDRMAYWSHLINMTGDSYRIMATKEWNEKHKSSCK